MSTSRSSQGLRTRCWFAVVQAYQACERQYARLLARLDLTIPQYDALSVIHEAEGEATPALIAERLMVTRGNVTPLLRRLVERGWVRERPHPGDRRSFLLSLSPAGGRLLKRARLASSAFIAEQLAPFGDAEVAQTVQQMQTMRAHLEAMDVEHILGRTRRA